LLLVHNTVCVCGPFPFSVICALRNFIPSPLLSRQCG
jgi:hypothetical protein